MSKLPLSFFTVIPSPYQQELFRALARRDDVDLRVFYFAARVGDRNWGIPRLGPTEQVMEGRPLRGLGASAHWNPSIRKLMPNQRGRLSVVSDYSAPTAQYAMRWLNRQRWPWVFWGERPGLRAWGWLGRGIRFALQAPLRSATGVAGIGAAAREAYRQIVPVALHANIPYFCDLSRFRAAEPRKQDGRIRFLFSGQLIERKGVHDLLDAFLSLAVERPEMDLRLLGNGPLEAPLRNRIPPSLRLRVEFCGHVEPAELPAAFADADVFVLPSRHDGWGVVVNEAIGAGLPVIVSDAVGAAEWITPEVSGLVFPAGDTIALRAAMRRLAEDVALRQRFSAAARERAAALDVDEGARRWVEFARAVMAR